MMSEDNNSFPITSGLSSTNESIEKHEKDPNKTINDFTLFVFLNEKKNLKSFLKNFRDSSKSLLSLIHLSSSIRNLLLSSVTYQSAWKRQYIDRWGDLSFMISILHRCNLIEESPKELYLKSLQLHQSNKKKQKQKQEKEKDLPLKLKWVSLYLQRSNRERQQEEGQMINKSLEYVRNGLEFIQKFENNQRIKRIFLKQSSNLFLMALSFSSDLPDIYLSLAYLLSLDQQYFYSSTVLELFENVISQNDICCVDIDPTKLQTHITEQLKLSTSEKYHGLLNKKTGRFESKVSNALTELFEKFDQDNDSQWNRHDLDSFIAFTNELKDKQKQIEENKKNEIENQNQNQNQNQIENENEKQNVENDENEAEKKQKMDENDEKSQQQGPPQPSVSSESSSQNKKKKKKKKKKTNSNSTNKNQQTEESKGIQSSDEFYNWITTNHDTTSSGFLSRDGFLQFFYSQTLLDPEETRRDLSKHGYIFEISHNNIEDESEEEEEEEEVLLHLDSDEEDEESDQEVLDKESRE